MAPQDLRNLNVACIVRRRNADEGDTCGLSTARVIHGVAQVPDRPLGIAVLDQQQSVRSGFWIRYRIVGDNEVEAAFDCISSERYVQFVFRAASENRQGSVPAQLVQQS